MTRSSTLLLVAALLLVGCSRHSPPSSSAQTPGPAGPGAAARSTPGSAPWAGRTLRGTDPEALRQYFQSVQEVKATKFKVQWNPATVAIDRDTAMRSLRSVSRDGVTFVFAAAEPAVAKLKPGSILWVWDLALRKVDAVNTQAGLTSVHTQPVLLTEAMPNADIEFDAAVPLQNYLLSWQKPAVGTPAAAAFLRHAAGVLVPVRYVLADPQPGGAPGPDTPGGAGPAPGDAPTAPGDAANPANDDAANDAEEQSFQGNAYTGTLKGFKYSVGYAPQGGGLKISLQARDEEDSGGGGDEDSGAPDSKSIDEKYKELEEQEKEAHEAIAKARQDDWNDEQQIRTLDDDYQKQLAQMKQDDLDRRNPSYTGPTPPPRQTDSNGTPLTEQAMEGKLTQQYDQQRSLATKQLVAKRQILAQWQVKKEELEQQKRMLKAAGKAVKELYSIVSENVDVRFKFDADLSGFSAAGAYQIANGDLSQAQMQFKNMSGHVKAAFTGRLGKPGNKGIKVPVMNLPIVFNVPLPVDGIPFVVQLGADFLLTVFLAGNHATLNVTGDYAFNGTSGFTYSKSKASYTNDFSGGDPGIGSYQGASLGVSAVVLGVQLPRIGFGLSVLGVSSIAYFDVVHVITMTQSADAAVGMLAPRCKRITYNAAGHVGIQTDALPIPIESVQKIASEKLSGKKEIFNHSKEVLDPPIKGCEV